MGEKGKKERKKLVDKGGGVVDGRTGKDERMKLNLNSGKQRSLSKYAKPPICLAETSPIWSEY